MLAASRENTLPGRCYIISSLPPGYVTRVVVAFSALSRLQRMASRSASTRTRTSTLALALWH